MQATSIVQNLIPQQHNSQNVTLNNGQMVYGKVNKIYSNQTAEISIGQSKVMAKLDAPIKVGERYWFQVQNTSDITALKVLQNNGGSENLKEMSQQLLQHLSLSQTKESLALAQFYVKNQIPITKDQFVQALQIISSSDDLSQSIKILQTINSLSLPVTKEVFQSLSAFENNVTLQSLFKDILQNLNSSKSVSEASLKSVLIHLLSTNLDKMAERGLQKIVAAWLSSEGQIKNQLFKVLQNVGLFSEQTNQNKVFTQALHLLENNNIIVRNSSLENSIQLLNELLRNSGQSSMYLKNAGNTNDKFQENILNLAKLINEKVQTVSNNSTEKPMWKQLLQEIVSLQVKKNENIHQNNVNVTGTAQSIAVKSGDKIPIFNAIMNMTKHILSFLNTRNNDFLQAKSMLELFSLAGDQSGNYEVARNNIGNMLMQKIESHQPKNYLTFDNKLLQGLLQEEVAALHIPQANIFSNEMKSAIRLMGLGLENHMANLDQGTVIEENELLNLKPLLLKFLNENLNHVARESAEQLLHKITAQQMLSQSSGPLQHIMLSFPFSYHRYHTEATMHFSGRKKNEGEIDPSFCRVLFYLQLDHINETVIDMVVQNKIMKINIINEKANLLKTLASPLVSEVKEKLEEVGYQLSAITFEPPKSLGPIAMNLERNKKIYETTPYNGEDIKI